MRARMATCPSWRGSPWRSAWVTKAMGEEAEVEKVRIWRGWGDKVVRGVLDAKVDKLEGREWAEQGVQRGGFGSILK